MAKFNLSAPLTASEIEAILLTAAAHPHASIVDTTASITLPTTPTVYVCPILGSIEGMDYDTVTGIFTFNTTDSYHMTMNLNAVGSSSSRDIYFYAEINTGAGWVPERYSARRRTLTSSTTVEQVTISADLYLPAGALMRFYIWGEATTYLKSADLPDTTAGTVTLAACRINWAS
jgi:hypothetical protein